MFNKGNRWLTVLILSIGVLAFVGFSIVPFIGAFRGESSTNPSPTASPASASAALEDQAKGYELVLQREPENQAALRGLIETRIQQGNLPAAATALEKLVKLNPEQPEYAILLAQVKQRAGDAEGAAQTYRTLLDKQPGSVDALQGLVALLIQQKRPEAAIGLLQDTLKKAATANEVKPGSVNEVAVQLLLGQVYAREKRYDEAIVVYDELMQKTNNTDFAPIFGKAVVLKAQGKDQEAAPLFTSAASLAPAEFKDEIGKWAKGELSLNSPPSPAAAESPASASPAPVTPASPVPSPAPAGAPASPAPVP